LRFASWQGVEQFLGPADEDGIAAIRWLTIDPRHRSYRVAVHAAQDLDDEQHRDLDSLPPLGVLANEEYVGAGVELGLVAEEFDAIALAERHAGARGDRWVNFGVGGEEYADLISARRLCGDRRVDRTGGLNPLHPRWSKIGSDRSYR
jgi:hypothetical protein